MKKKIVKLMKINENKKWLLTSMNSISSSMLFMWTYSSVPFTSFTISLLKVSFCVNLVVSLKIFQNNEINMKIKKSNWSERNRKKKLPWWTK